MYVHTEGVVAIFQVFCFWILEVLAAVDYLTIEIVQYSGCGFNLVLSKVIKKHL